MCYNLTDNSLCTEDKNILSVIDMNEAVKEKTAPLVIGAVIAVLVFLLLMCAVLYITGDCVLIHMPQGESLAVECGETYDDSDVKAYFKIPFTNMGLPLELSRMGYVDSTRVGTYELLYVARFMGIPHSAKRTVTVVDTTAPEIVLKTDPDYQADWLVGYVEEGYTATDAADGDLTEKVSAKRLDGAVEYTVTDEAGNKASLRREIEYQLNLPVITLNGGEKLSLCALPWYNDPGFTATDAQGNDYADYVKVEGQVDSAKAGDYEIVYSLENGHGDTVTAKRTVTVDMDDCGEVCEPEEKTIYLTFDDGPGSYTDTLLDILDAYGAKATFFVTGAYPEYARCIKRAHDAGHAIGVHTFTHWYGKIYSSEENFFQDFLAVQNLIYEQTGEYTQLYRFPGGSSNTASFVNYGIMTRLSQSLEDMGYRYFDWNVNSGDADGLTGAGSVANAIIRGCAGKNCAVVLQHDIKGFSVYAVEKVLQWGQENGYSFKALDTTSPGMHHQIVN